MMSFVDYLNAAKAAEEDNAHVGVLMHYRSAVKVGGYVAGSAIILLEAVKYAQRLKKERDKNAVAYVWGAEALGRIGNTSLREIIETEITKLNARGDKNATP